MINTILNFPAIEGLVQIEEKSVNCCVTSPPYYGLRNYGHPGQIGLEASPEEFIKKLVEVFRGVKRVLRDDGTLWVNIGDSYCGYKGDNYQTSKAKSKSNLDKNNQTPGGHNIGTPSTSGVKNKDLIGIPWMLAFALRSDGWYLRQDIIWHKPNPMPESVTDRCTKAHEYIFLLSKSPKYYFDHKSNLEPAVTGYNGSQFYTGKTGERQLGRASKQPRFGGVKYGDSNDPLFATKSGNEYKPNGERNKRSVWSVATKPFKGAHFAVFPPELITPCILSGCPEGGVVLDPFFGSGTTGVVARKNGRNFIGIEINEGYVELANNRIKNELGLWL